MYTNYWTGAPIDTTNRNVPSGAEIVGEVRTMSGECITTYYCQRYNPPHPTHGKWALWKVGDWCTEKPQPTNAAEWERAGLIPADRRPPCLA